MMRQMTAEEIGLDMETVIRFLRFYSDDKVIEGVSRLYGYEQLLKELTRKMGEERALKELAQMVGKKRLRQMVEQLFPEESDNNDD